MDKGAEISKDEKYRYSLWRIWDRDKDFVAFIMLNPSTADANKDDATIRKCIAYAKRWGYGGIYVGNLYAYRSRDPKVLGKVEDPVGPDCDTWLVSISAICKIRIAAWGNNVISKQRIEQVRRVVPRLHYLELSKSGQPKHPLYLRKNLTPRKF